ncbi:hypothetical protein ICW40_07500 [Actinotalea ferrariae]|uniref:hypothetical protein n=1 Tax=Actinotalea ferrariae TaxID=1386098 RepID=UPI001C8C9F4C|nr:hypothetical protein [Actinotalea ferrariae]MBX9244654.1 hypothetical protein [Actinotalea ferrariae]
MILGVSTRRPREAPALLSGRVSLAVLGLGLGLVLVMVAGCGDGPRGEGEVSNDPVLEAAMNCVGWFQSAENLALSEAGDFDALRAAAREADDAKVEVAVDLLERSSSDDSEAVSLDDRAAAACFTAYGLE